MAKKSSPPKKELEPIPTGQQWFDRIFLLLVLSILISGLAYNAWGLIELFVVTR